MPTIRQLSSIDAIGDGDAFPMYSAENDEARKVTPAVIAAKVQSLIEGEPDETVYALTVVGTTFSTTIEPATVGGNVYAQITLSGAFTAGTITLPGADVRGNGQEVLVTCTQAVAALTINGSGAAVNGAPTTIAANGFFKLRYDNIANAWFRVG